MAAIVKMIFRNILESIVGILFSVLIIITLLGVFYRYVLNDPISWTEELGRYLMIWMTLFGATVGVKRGIHLRLEINLFSLFPKWAIPAGKMLIDICVMCLLFVVAFYGIKYCKVAQAYTSPVLGISMGYIWSAVPLNGFLMLLLYGHSMLVEARKKLHGGNL
jgi:TRAP-type transport system small permease protein